MQRIDPDQPLPEEKILRGLLSQTCFLFFFLLFCLIILTPGQAAKCQRDKTMTGITVATKRSAAITQNGESELVDEHIVSSSETRALRLCVIT